MVRSGNNHHNNLHLCHTSPIDCNKDYLHKDFPGHTAHWSLDKKWEVVLLEEEV
jgi:hypothetical protein